MSTDNKLVKFTILHSNDLHGDFLPHEENGHMVGGLSRLSGYVKKVREEEENVLYFNSGDMFNGSIIDSEYKGLVTTLLLNNMTIDCATIGNHEVDYGVPHLVFVNKCTDFPLVNCNLYIPLLHKRLFEPYILLEKAGVRILVSGFLTKSAIDQTKNDELISSLLDIVDPLDTLDAIIESSGKEEIDSNIDLTIVLSHIGYEEDKAFAKALSEYNISPNLIIGGHSHTLPDDLIFVGDTAIVQAGTGSGHIGRLDVYFNKETKEFEPDSWTWQAIEINEETAPNDEIIDQILDYFKNETDKKYNCVLTVLDRELTHPFRFIETELGNFYCDLIKDATGAEIVFLGSGSIRGNHLPKVATRNDYLTNFPYVNELQIAALTGSQIRTIFTTILSLVSKLQNNPYLQVSKGFEVEYNWQTGEITKLRLNGEDIVDENCYYVCMQKYSLDSISKYGLNIEDIKANHRIVTIAVSDRAFIEEELSNPDTIKDAKVEGRIVLTPHFEFPMYPSKKE